MFIDEGINVDRLKGIMGPTTLMHDHFESSNSTEAIQIPGRRRAKALLRVNKTWCGWLCGQCAETFTLVLLRKYAIPPLHIVHARGVKAATSPTYAGKRVSRPVLIGL